MMNKLFLILAIVSVASSFWCNAFGQSGTLNGHEWVDLGLPSGTKWATCNVGASNPREYGKYFAWGETKSKNRYTEDSYMYFSDSSVLPAGADVATASWGAGWRMPTLTDFKELITNCKWTLMEDGYKAVGPNGNGIFLPSAGVWFDDLWSFSRGHYWSSSIDPNDVNTSAWSFSWISEGIYQHAGMIESQSRISGLSVRPVCKQKK